MAGTVLYRKWRPQHFADIVGQDPIVRTLKNTVAQDKIAHAYLFAGPRGTGKTTAGRILAKAINAGTTDDGELVDDAAAQDFESSLDLIEIDAASNRGIDDIRDLRDRAQYAPSASRYKVYLIDEVHQLTGPAADALLKTLEEPPPHVIFILATTDPEQLKSTVRSRCQRFDFRRISVEALVGRLRYIADNENIEIPDEALNIIAREATGSARDAVNLLDQAWATYGDEISLDNTVEALGLTIDKRALDVARAALTKDLPAGLSSLAAVQDDAVDLNRFKRQVVLHLRHALLVQTGAAEGLGLSQPEREALDELVKGAEIGVTVAALKAFNA
ncbi:MAG TPA: DNA polymerase III subunit gamma/tau, partial [Dehalococcoidia bacterium]|nr:DNA polymerase III subunit gamma/tau [Dehalococcoidia bacterium]